MLHFTYFNIMAAWLGNLLGMVLGQVIQQSGDNGSNSGLVNRLLQNELNKKVKGSSDSKPKVKDNYQKSNLF